MSGAEWAIVIVVSGCLLVLFAGLEVLFPTTREPSGNTHQETRETNAPAARIR
ncbi:hypothetical protein [Candidatus Nitrospira bockiana]